MLQRGVRVFVAGLSQEKKKYKSLINSPPLSLERDAVTCDVEFSMKL